MNISYRPITESEYPFLEEMLYEALFVPEGKPKLPRSLLKNPDIKKYVESWNQKKDDIAIVALNGDELVGAIWGRRFQANKKGYGYIDERTPEISMAVKNAYRNKGIGTKLLKQIEIAYLQTGINKLSLSVDKLNPAKLLYKRNGYKIYEEAETALTMLKHLNII